MAKAVLGVRGDPLAKSLEMNEQAVACNPYKAGTWKELAATQLCIDTRHVDPAMRAKGQASIERGLAIEPRNADEALDIEHLKRLRDTPASACAYIVDDADEVIRE